MEYFPSIIIRGGSETVLDSIVGVSQLNKFRACIFYPLSVDSTTVGILLWRDTGGGWLPHDLIRLLHDLR